MGGEAVSVSFNYYVLGRIIGVSTNWRGPYYTLKDGNGDVCTGHDDKPLVFLHWDDAFQWVRDNDPTADVIWEGSHW